MEYILYQYMSINVTIYVNKERNESNIQWIITNVYMSTEGEYTTGPYQCM